MSQRQRDDPNANLVRMKKLFGHEMVDYAGALDYLDYNQVSCWASRILRRSHSPRRCFDRSLSLAYLA